MPVLFLINLGLLTNDRTYDAFNWPVMLRIVLLICQFFHRGVYELRFDNTRVRSAAIQIIFGNSQMQTYFKFRPIMLTIFRFTHLSCRPVHHLVYLFVLSCIICNL